MSAPYENEIQREIRLSLGNRTLFPSTIVWRNNAGLAVPVHGTRPQKYGLVDGAADLIGLSPGRCPSCHTVVPGRFTALELKRPTGRASDEQRLFLTLVRRAGGFGAIARSVEEARAAVERCAAGESE